MPYAAALSYLKLTMSDRVAEKLVSDLEAAPVTQYPARDIFRAAQIEPWNINDYFVWDAAVSLDKGNDPGLVLIFRTAGKAVIAAGFYDLCAVYHRDKYAVISCKVV